MDKVNEILPRLYQGGFPPRGSYLSKKGIRTLLLCAEELQEPQRDFPDVRVLYCPLRDNYEPLSAEQLWAADLIAKQAAEDVRSGRKVLVTCAAGINRSGLMTALIIRKLTGMSGRAAVALIRRKRPGALSNASFVTYLETLGSLSFTPDEIKRRRAPRGHI